MLVSRPLAGARTKTTAACQSSDSVGDLVYVSGSFSGNDYVVTKADVTQYVKMPTIAVITVKLSPTRCVIQFSGEVPGLYTGLSVGRVYFVGTDSRPTAVPPTPGLGQRLYLQSIGVAVDADVLRLNPLDDMKVRVG